MKSIIALLAIAFLSQTSATPDCYDFSVTERSENFDFLPKLLYYGSVDWLTL
jgi:hypothetical protein